MVTRRHRGPAAASVAAFAVAFALLAAPSPAEPPVEELARAAVRADTERLKALVHAGAPVNGRTRRQETPLQLAAGHGQTGNVTALLAAGAEIDATGARGITALGWAARNGHEPVVRLLLRSGANPDAASEPDRAPLPLAAAHGQYAIASLLVEHGSKLSERPELAGAVLDALAEGNSVNMTGLLVPRVAGLVGSSASLRETAAGAVAGSNAVIAQAVQKHLGPVAATPEFQTALLLAAIRRGRHELASAAVAGGADVNARHPVYGSALAMALAANDAGTVLMLLAGGADRSASDVDQVKLLAIAGEKMTEEKAAELAERVGASALRNDDGETLLFRAAQRGDFLNVRTLLRRGADAAATVRRWPGDSGWTPLMIAAASGHSSIVELLLKAGAPVDQRNAAGRTALSFAAFYGRAPAVSLLLAAGADPQAADSVGQTPLVLAAASGHPATIQLVTGAVRQAAPAEPAAAAAEPR